MLIISILFFGCGNGQVKEAVNAQTTHDIAPQQVELIYKNVKKFPNQTQVSIALIKGDEVVFYGIKRENDSIISFENRQNIFEIGSVTKVFTATILASLAEQGKLDLEDRINSYLPWDDSIHITFKQLANHTSGLPRMPSNFNLTALFNPDNPYKKYDEEKLMAYLSGNINLTNDPGKNYEYSNLGAGLLGYVMSISEKKDYKTLLEETIFSKYNLPNSTIDFEEVNRDKLVEGLSAKGKKTSNWEFDVLAGGGGIFSNVEDLSRFAQAQFDTIHKELMLARQKTFAISDNMSIGLGWHIIKTKSGDKWHWHNGGTGGYTSSMALDIENETGVILLSNVSAYNSNMGNIDALCFELMKTVNQL